MSVNVYGRTQAISAGDNHHGGGGVDLDLSSKVSRDGSLTMLGDLEMGNFNIKGLKDPVLGNDASTRFYVDSAINGKVSRDGSLPMTGDLNMGNFNIKGLKAPVLGTDASTKTYVDNADSAKVSRDGSIAMIGNLVMTNFNIKALKEPVLGSDASTKSYVDNMNSATNAVITAEMGSKVSRDGSLPMTGALYMSNFNINGLKEPVLGSDACTKSYVDSNNQGASGLNLLDKVSRNGSLAMTGNLNMANFNINMLKEPVLGTDASTKTYVDSANVVKVSRDGTLAMTGDLNMGNFGIKGLKIPSLGYEAATKSYVDGENSASSAIIAIELTNKLSRDGSIAMTGDLEMGNCNIKGLKEPVLGTDACTKNYVDAMNIGKKCHVGYIPHLSTNVANKNGFTPSASSEFNDANSSNNAFSTEAKEWRVDNVMTNFWIKIQCPERVKIWRFALRGCQYTTDRIFNWRFEGSNDNVTYDIIYSAASVYLGFNLQMYNVSPPNAYSYYRLFGLEANGPTSGLSYFQIFVYSD